MKDKTYYLNIGGQLARVRAPKKPDEETTKAIETLVKAVRMKKKPTHGGKRERAGRKSGAKAFKNVSKKEPTKVMRIPLSKVKQVEEIIKKF